MRKSAIISPWLSPTAMEPTFPRFLNSVAQASIASRASVSLSSKFDCIFLVTLLLIVSYQCHRFAPRSASRPAIRRIVRYILMAQSAPDFLPSRIIAPEVTPATFIDWRGSRGYFAITAERAGELELIDMPGNFNPISCHGR